MPVLGLGAFQFMGCEVRQVELCLKGRRVSLFGFPVSLLNANKVYLILQVPSQPSLSFGIRLSSWLHTVDTLPRR